MITRKSLFGAAALLVASTQGAAAATYTLDFSGNICSGGGGNCFNGAEILQTYGDQTGVDVVYDGFPGDAGLQNLRYWADSYSGLTGIAYYGDGATITFNAATGYEVGLTSLSLGGWPNTTRPLGFSITDLATSSELLNTGIVAVLGSTPSVFNFDYKSTVGLKITFLGDFYNGGVDNIVYTVSDVNGGGGVNPIPLPAAAWLLLGGLGALGAVARRRG